MGCDVRVALAEFLKNDIFLHRSIFLSMSFFLSNSLSISAFSCNITNFIYGLVSASHIFISNSHWEGRRSGGREVGRSGGREAGR